MRKIEIRFIKHKCQRYDTCGDWFFTPDGDLLISVSDTGNYLFNFLVAVHEVIEAILCKQRNIPEEEITEFDKNFEIERLEGNIDEPGNSPKAPYNKEHVFATKIEYQIAEELNINIKEYENALENL